MAETLQAADAPDAAGETLVSWRPRSVPQAAYITCPIFEIFYGGARGSLKTEGTLGDWIQHSNAYGEDAVGIMLRKTREQLAETFERAKRILRPLGFHPAGHTITSPQGARLRFGYLERDADAENHQGDNNTRVYIEELGNFANPAPVMKMMATLRSTKGVPVGFRGTGNPGGPGHGWVKARYITPAPAGWKVIEEPFVNPWTNETVTKQRIFIPGRITDHNLLGAEYIANLQMSGSPEVVRAWLEGDWDVVAGAYFPEFTKGRHVLERGATFPTDWRRFTATDWGSARPFWTGWFVIVQKEMTWRSDNGRPMTLLPGAIVCYREWYGEDPKRPAQNLGIKLPIEEWADGVLKRSDGEEIAYDVVDSQVFAEDGGPSLAERAFKVRRKGKRLNLRKADKQRLPGWNQVRARLRGDLPEEKAPPMIFFTANCPDAIRTLAAIQHDDVESKFEDAETEGEDHPCFAAGTMVRTPDGDIEIEKLPPAGTVCTRRGVQRYRDAGMTRASAPRVRLFFSDGSVVVCTPDHRFITENGWTPAKELTGSWLPSAPRCRSSTASGITSAARTFSAMASAFIARCGNGITVLSLRAFTFTMWTKTAPTTASPILAYSQRQITERSTATMPRYRTAHGALRPNGTDQPRGGHGTPRTGRGSAWRRWLNWLRDAATNAAPSIKRLLCTSTGANSALLPAERVRCVGVEQASAGPVYCLTVDSVREFLLSSGLAVHNCDGIRYGCMSRPRKLPDPEDRFKHLPKKGTMEWLMNEGWKGQSMPGLSKRPLGCRRSSCAQARKRAGGWSSTWATGRC